MNVENSSEFLEGGAEAVTLINRKYCDPCQLSSKSYIALKYCKDCEEKLCGDCCKRHATRKATSSHKPVPIQDMQKTSSFLCSPCCDDNIEVKAVAFCQECEEYLCEGCTNSHKNRKATKQHKPVAVELLKHQYTQSDEMVPSCQPCKFRDETYRASKYCRDCEEYLCDNCTRHHSIRKATKSHSLVPVSTQRHQVEEEEIKLCDPCICLDRNEVAKSFCLECNELLCGECSKRHRSNKFTKTHMLKSSECVEYVTSYCDICDNETTMAVMFCNLCEEALCEHCAAKHKKQKMTRDHNIEPVKSITIKQKIMCDPCEENNIVRKAETFCKQCEEYLCESCTRYHKAQKLTKQHELANPESAVRVTGRLCDICAENESHVNAIDYCLECSEALCNDCSQKHKKQKLTKDHEITPISEAPRPERKVCDQCQEGSEAVKYCSDCQDYLCADCCKTHKRLKASSNHYLQEIGDLEKWAKKNCDFCKTTGTAESYCDECEEFYCKYCSEHHLSLKATRNHNLHSTEEHAKKRNARPGADDSMKLRGQVADAKEDRVAKAARQSEKDKPGKPRSSEVLANSITLSWDPPSKYGDDGFYQVSYKDLDHENKWKLFPGEFKQATAVLTELKSNTAFIFRVHVVYEDREGTYSEVSDPVSTTYSFASQVLQFSQVKVKGNPSPTIYALPLVEVREARNENAKTRKFEFGSPSNREGESKTIMLVGGVGTGKSTMVDAIVNYLLGVKWDDPFRFIVTYLDEAKKDRGNTQALSQTEWITCYTLNPEKGSRLKFQLHIIDTPGFGDTRGMKRDKEIIEQIRQLFSEKQPRGVTFIDAVCFLIKAPDARLTPIQNYIFDTIMSLFGKDIEKNICPLVTFADGLDPPVLHTLRQSRLPFEKIFKFNNSGLFAKNVNLHFSSFSPMFWDMGLNSFRAFFDHIEQVETNSLQLTKDVLDERSRLEATVLNLQPQLDAGLLKVNTFKQEIKIIEEKKSRIKDNKNFELLSQEQIVEKLGEELNDLLENTEDMMLIIRICNERLKEIALRPNPLLVTEHIDLMIENEKLMKNDGFFRRINILYDFRKKAQISTAFEMFKQKVQATLGTVGKKRNRDAKSLMAKVDAWLLKNTVS